MTAMSQRKIEGRERILGDAGGPTCAAMAEEQGKVGHCAFYAGIDLGLELFLKDQSKSKSRMVLPVSGDSFAFLTASWNFFSSRSEACFCASTDCRKIESRRLSCSFMARAASSMSANIFGFTAAVWAITPLLST